VCAAPTGQFVLRSVISTDNEHDFPQLAFWIELNLHTLVALY
jgi:hypothetical protein